MKLLITKVYILFTNLIQCFSTLWRVEKIMIVDRWFDLIYVVVFILITPSGNQHKFNCNYIVSDDGNTGIKLRAHAC